jgi:hypothetical protein
MSRLYHSDRKADLNGLSVFKIKQDRLGCPVVELIQRFIQAVCTAPVGQTSAQEPQSWHFAPSILYKPFTSAIAVSGHSGSQAPHWMQSSLITYDIESSSLTHSSDEGNISNE